jgi:ABC-type nitrate/sulfonate/bicarbonate transport system ATPase subunit
MVFHTKKGSVPRAAEIDLTVRKGEFITLIGHSGCGKSTLLNLIAGLLKPTDGVLLCANREIAGPSPERAVVFQNHSLLPWLTCYENIYLASSACSASRIAHPAARAHHAGAGAGRPDGARAKRPTKSRAA